MGQYSILGRISTAGSLGNQIAIACKRKTASEAIITIITARNMPFVELDRTIGFRFQLILFG
jgi:hypothetical protein